MHDAFCPETVDCVCRVMPDAGNRTYGAGTTRDCGVQRLPFNQSGRHVRAVTAAYLACAGIPECDQSWPTDCSQRSHLSGGPLQYLPPTVDLQCQLVRRCPAVEECPEHVSLAAIPERCSNSVATTKGRMNLGPLKRWVERAHLAPRRSSTSSRRADSTGGSPTIARRTRQPPTSLQPI